MRLLSSGNVRLQRLHLVAQQIAFGDPLLLLFGAASQFSDGGTILVVRDAHRKLRADPADACQVIIAAAMSTEDVLVRRVALLTEVVAFIDGANDRVDRLGRHLLRVAQRLSQFAPTGLPPLQAPFVLCQLKPCRGQFVFDPPQGFFQFGIPQATGIEFIAALAGDQVQLQQLVLLDCHAFVGTCLGAGLSGRLQCSAEMGAVPLQFLLRSHKRVGLLFPFHHSLQQRCMVGAPLPHRRGRAGSDADRRPQCRPTSLSGSECLLCVGLFALGKFDALLSVRDVLCQPLSPHDLIVGKVHPIGDLIDSSDVLGERLDPLQRKRLGGSRITPQFIDFAVAAATRLFELFGGRHIQIVPLVKQPRSCLLECFGLSGKLRRGSLNRLLSLLQVAGAEFDLHRGGQG